MEFLPDLLTVVEWATVIVSFVMMGSVIPLCLNMYKKKSTDNVPYLLFLVSTFLTIMGLQYGIMVSSNMIIFINIVGVFLWGTYISVYIFVSSSKGKPLLGLLSVAGLYMAHQWHLSSMPPVDYHSTFGSYMLVWTLIISILPVGEIFTILQEKSTNCCDVTMLIGGTMNATVWCLYGFLVNDIYIYFPSFPGLTVNFIKFSLMLVYGFPSGQSVAKEAISRDKTHKDLDNSVKNDKAGETLRQRN